jgi:hypothetical protein
MWLFTRDYGTIKIINYNSNSSIVYAVYPFDQWRTVVFFGCGVLTFKPCQIYLISLIINSNNFKKVTIYIF